MDSGSPPLGGLAQPREGVVEVGGALVEIAGADATLDALQVDLDAQRRAAEHGDGQRLRAAHAAEPGGDDEAAREGAVEALAGGGREGLVRALEDPLGPDVDPGPGRHLAVHHQPGGVELAEVLPGRPVGDEVGVGDEHARRRLVRLDDGDGLARLDEQRLVVAEALELAPDRLVAGAVARGLADPAVDDELVGLLGDVGVEVVLEHAQGRLLLPAAAAQPVARGGHGVPPVSVRGAAARCEARARARSSSAVTRRPASPRRGAASCRSSPAPRSRRGHPRRARAGRPARRPAAAGPPPPR